MNDYRRPTNYLTYAATAAVAAVPCIAGLALIGHLTRTPQLYSLHLGFQAMALTTACMLSLTSAAALMALRGIVGGWREGACILSGVIALVVLGSHALVGQDIVNPTIADAIGLDPASIGRTSISTAICIACLALSLHPGATRFHQLGDGLAAFAFFIALLALGAYAYSSNDGYALPLFRNMALNTAIAILLLSMATILGRGGDGWGATIVAPGKAGRSTRRQLLVLLVPPVLGWMLVKASNAGQLGVGSAMALLVAFTIAPLMWVILRDGRGLAALERERRAKGRLKAEHMAMLEARLKAQALELDMRSQARLLTAEQAKLKSEGRYRLLFDSIDAGFCVIEMDFDPDGVARSYRFTEVNAAFEAHTGLHDAVGKWIHDLIPDHEQRWCDIYGKVAKTGEAIRFDSPAQRLARWYDIHAFPVDDPAMNRVGILFDDISARRRAEQALIDMNATLEARVTAEVAEREKAQAALLQSQKMEAMGQLTGGVAHDFNNLLTPIVGTLDLLARRDGNSDRERRLLDAASQAADRAKTLVQRLLAFARRQPLQAEPVDIAALIRGMAGLVASTSGPQVHVAVEIAPVLPPALADANQLEMAILNLCVNARDAMPEGGTLTIAATGERLPAGGHDALPAGDYIRLAVSDTGTGMDAETMKRAVEPFYSTKGIGKGTGLGLSMVHGLAAQLKGTLDIRSREGLGTRIDLWLPASTMPAAAEVAADDPVVPQSRDGRGRALVVDDETIVRMTTADMLQDMGYETLEANSAREAYALMLDGVEFDLIVTDHLMPGMTGAELALAVRRHRPGLPLLLVSGYADAASIPEDLPRLAKPFRRGELEAAIAELN